MPLTRAPVTAPHHGPLKLGCPKPIASDSQAKPHGICRKVLKLGVATIAAPPGALEMDSHHALQGTERRMTVKFT
jgi:hypothetical protein